MSTFTLNSITVKGLNVIAKLIAGSTLEFTRIAIGDGAMPSGKTPLTVTDLSHRLFDVPIDSVTSGGNGEATVTGIFSNDDRDTGFFYRELGLFAKDPASGAEILYCYGNAAADAEWISPSGASSLIEKKVKIVTLVGNAETVKAQIASGLYETKENVAKIASMKADLDTTAANGGRLLASQMRLDQEQTLYVDAAAANGGDGSEAKPFKTIQAAINARYLGAPVIYIKIKSGTYSEDIKTPWAPNTTWRLMKNGTGVVTINTAIIDNCNYVVFDSLTFKGGAVANSTIIYIANTASANFNNVTVNGNANLTGIHFTTSRGVLNNTQLNNCGLAIASTEGACINLRNTSGTGNIRGVHADGAFVTCSDHTIQANTPFSRINGGGITAEGGDSSIPSNFAQLYNLGEFATANTLKAKLLEVFGTLAQNETKACSFKSSITSGFGEFKTTQKVQCIISKLNTADNGYGLITFYAYGSTAISVIKIINGVFTPGEPESLSSVKTVNDKGPDAAGNIALEFKDFADIQPFVDKIYPVGAIYMSTVSTSPAELFGGTWEVMPAGRVLLAQGTSEWGVEYQAGSTGGEHEHQLSVGELPSHFHEIVSNTVNLTGSAGYFVGADSPSYSGILTVTKGSKGLTGGGGGYTQNYLNIHANITPSVNVSVAGNNHPHQNMPPFISIFCWKRIA